MIIIIGGGAAGLYCAAQFEDQELLIVEKNSRLGLKLLISGNGQCNLTHAGTLDSFLRHYGRKGSFVTPAIRAHDNLAVQQTFESFGVPLVQRADGKIFPQSMRSKDVLEALLGQIHKNKKAKILTDARVIGIQAFENGFGVETSQGQYLASSIVLALGGDAYPQLGSTGDGYALAASLGHTIIEPKSALSAVYIKDSKLKALQGLVINQMTFQVRTSSGKTQSFCGDVLFTHFGLSGPGILDHSREMNAGDTLELNFTRQTRLELESLILKEIDRNGKLPIAYLLNHLGLPERVKQLLVHELGLDLTQKLSVVSKQERKELLQWLCAYPLKIVKLSDRTEAMATAGGVCVSEISSKTMMSKICSGLYIIGEIMDVDGDTGGYNLQWAFSSAKAASVAIEKRNKRGQKHAK